MNTEIKYRIWDTGGKKFWNGPFNDRLNEIFEKKRFIFNEFTGLLDKNGREIYEDDIVSTIYPIKYPIGAVVFSQDVGAYRINCKETLVPIVTYRFVNGEPQGLLSCVDSVLGNVFENPELLKT